MLSKQERIQMIGYIVRCYREGATKPSSKAVSKFENKLQNASDEHVRHLFELNKIKEKKK